MSEFHKNLEAYFLSREEQAVQFLDQQLSPLAFSCKRLESLSPGFLKKRKLIKLLKT
jgi:hypothetical protein